MQNTNERSKKVRRRGRHARAPRPPWPRKCLGSAASCIAASCDAAPRTRAPQEGEGARRRGRARRLRRGTGSRGRRSGWSRSSPAAARRGCQLAGSPIEQGVELTAPQQGSQKLCTFEFVSALTQMNHEIPPPATSRDLFMREVLTVPCLRIEGMRVPLAGQARA